MKIRWVDLFY